MKSRKAKKNNGGGRADVKKHMKPGAAASTGKPGAAASTGKHGATANIGKPGAAAASAEKPAAAVLSGAGSAETRQGSFVAAGEKGADSLEVSRHEIKFFTNPVKSVMLANALRNVMVGDPHNGRDGYIVRSLYFDAYAETDFYQKLSGDENRKKIRLRVYSPGDAAAKLEIKRKNGDEQVKKSAVISRGDAVRLINCDYDALLKYDNKTAKMLYEVMRINRVRPVALVEYNRLAFMHPTNNIRITLDSNIRASETCFDLFASDPPMCPAEEFAFALTEVKYDAFIMRWLSDILSQFDMTRGAYSKYVVSRGLAERCLA